MYLYYSIKKYSFIENKYIFFFVIDYEKPISNHNNGNLCGQTAYSLNKESFMCSSISALDMFVSAPVMFVSAPVMFVSALVMFVCFLNQL